MQETARRLAEMDRRRRALLQAVLAMEPALREARPGEGRWSILEIVEHLVRVEDGLLERLRSPEQASRRRSLKHRLLYRVVMGVLRSPVRVKAPVVSMLPTGSRDFQTLQADWDANHVELRERVAEMDDPSRIVTSHPIAGPMTMDEAVAMLEVHLRRHLRQVRKVEAELLQTSDTSESSRFSKV